MDNLSIFLYYTDFPSALDSHFISSSSSLSSFLIFILDHWYWNELKSYTQHKRQKTTRKICLIIRIIKLVLQAIHGWTHAWNNWVSFFLRVVRNWAHLLELIIYTFIVVIYTCCMYGINNIIHNIKIDNLSQMNSLVSRIPPIPSAIYSVVAVLI